MTFIAQLGDRVISPEEASKTDTLHCIECDDPLSVVESHRRSDGTFVSRHFRHASESCGGGESDTHFAMKSIALSKLKEVYPSYAATDLDTITIGDHQPDAYLRFDEPHDTLGYGVVVEAQYRNKGKDTEAAERDYLEHGYSVYWLYESDYSGYDVDLGIPEMVWPEVVQRRLKEWDSQPTETTRLLDELRAQCEPQPPRHVKLPDEWYRDVVPLFWFYQLQRHPARIPDASEWEDNAQAKARAKNVAENDKLLKTTEPTYRLYRDLIADVRDQCEPMPPRNIRLPGTPHHDEIRALEYYHNEWESRTGADVFLTAARDRCERPSTPVRFPLDYYEWLEEYCRDIHKAYSDAASANVGLLYELSENNAPRVCVDCDNDAQYYVFTDSVISEFTCDDHLQDTLASASPSGSQGVPADD